MGALAPPNVHAEQRLLDRYRRDGDQTALDELLRRMAPLVRRVASAYRAPGHEEDLVQVAWLGLVKAIERYDRGRGTPLRAYAGPTMYGEVRRYLRDHTWAVHVPRPLQEQVLAVTKASDRLATRDGRSPTPQQISEELGIKLEQTLEALQAGMAHRITSLDAPTSDDETGTLGDVVGDDDERLQFVEDVVALRGLRDLLDARERAVLYLRFCENRTQSQIAARIGCSQMQISRVLRRALRSLREQASEQSQPPAVLMR